MNKLQCFPCREPAACRGNMKRYCLRAFDNTSIRIFAMTFYDID